MKNLQKGSTLPWIVGIIVLVVIGAVYAYTKNISNLDLKDESADLLAEIDKNGLQKFIDDHNILKDDVLFNRVCPQIETGEEDWVKIGAQMYYGKVVTNDAGFDETIDLCLGNALDKSPVTVFRSIKSFPQIKYYHSRKDSSVISNTASTTAVDVIKEICSRTNYDMNDSEPASVVYSKIIGQLKTRKNVVEGVTDVDIIDLKTACLGNINSQIKSLSSKLGK